MVDNQVEEHKYVMLINLAIQSHVFDKYNNKENQTQWVIIAMKMSGEKKYYDFLHNFIEPIYIKKKLHL